YSSAPPFYYFSFTTPAPTQIYTLSLHDALPILLQDGQRRGRRQRPEDQLRQPRRRLRPAQDGRDGAPAPRARAGALPLPDARHSDQHRHLEVHERPTRAPPLRGDRRHEVGRSQGTPVDDGLAADLPGRGAHLRGVHPEASAEREDRDPLSERRLRQGLPEGLQ